MITPILDEKLVKETLERGIERIYPSTSGLENALQSGKPLRFYYGIDPTSPNLHLGHTIPLFILRRLQKLGHEITILIGDFTAMIGDPTEKSQTRVQLSEGEVKENLKTYKKQLAKVIDFSGPNPARIKFNSKWLKKLSLSDVIRLAANTTVQQMIQRDMFQDRIKHELPIGLHEFLYPLLQGYDSVALDTDGEIGGNDQTFNMLVGRDLLKTYRQKEKFVIAAKLLVNPKTGKKMSKTEGEVINLADEPEIIFGKIMAQEDGLILPLAELATELPMERIRAIEAEIKSGKNPRDAKMEIAGAIVELLYSKEAAKRAKREFVKVFREKKAPSAMKEIKPTSNPIALLDLVMQSGFADSKSAARRLIEQGAVRLDDAKKTDSEELISIAKKTVLQVGPRNFIRISP